MKKAGNIKRSNMVHTHITNKCRKENIRQRTIYSIRKYILFLHNDNFFNYGIC